jgi:RNA polymerase sigma-70 factor, ECF subfamily
VTLRPEADTHEVMRRERERQTEFERIYREHLSDVKRYARSQVGHVDADDIVSATFMSVWNRFDDTPVLSERAWILGIVRNHCLNEWRSRRRFAGLVDAVITARPQIESRLSAANVGLEAYELFGSEMASWSADDCELFVLSCCLEYTPSEIAEVIGAAPGATRMRLQRFRQRATTPFRDIEMQGGAA